MLYDIDARSTDDAKKEERKLRKRPKVKKAKVCNVSYSTRKMQQSDYASHASDVESRDDMNMTLESLASSSNMEPFMKKLKIARKFVPFFGQEK